MEIAAAVAYFQLAGARAREYSHFLFSFSSHSSPPTPARALKFIGGRCYCARAHEGMRERE